MAASKKNSNPMEGRTLKTEKRTKAAREGRRDFLRLATVGTVAAAAVGAGVTPARAAAASGDAGYVETDHVRAYYESCRF